MAGINECKKVSTSFYTKNTITTLMVIMPHTVKPKGNDRLHLPSLLKLWLLSNTY